MSDINFLARFAYGLGQDPIDYAVEAIIQTHVETWLTICASRIEDPASFPGYALELTPAALSRRILGDLLDAGWTPPQFDSEEADQ